MKLANPSEMKKLDEKAIAYYGIPGILLMENAALQLAKKACEMLQHDRKRSIIAITGKGNNGGDAFAAVRHLHQWGYTVSVISLVPRTGITGDAESFLVMLEKTGIEIAYIDDGRILCELLSQLQDLSLVLDGIFGTGIHGQVTGIFSSAIEAINASDAQILSVDIPSGIHGKTGQVCGSAVKAHETVTFSLPKPGLWQYPGRAHAGNITVADIGIPPEAVRMAGLTGELLEASNMSGILPERLQDGHKGNFGKVLIITGSAGMTGAGTLVAKAAFKTGSGLVYLAVPGSLSTIYSITIPEAITLAQEEEDGIIGAGNLEALLKRSETMDVVVIGPGFSSKPAMVQWVNAFIRQCRVPMIIDADALNVLVPEVLRERKAPAVITPHPGEFARLTGSTIEEIQKNRVESALEFSHKYQITVVLKGAGTVVAYSDGRYNINTSGHSCLAVAGSGDVLAGITGSLTGQGVSPEQAAALAVFIHGRCGEALAAENNQAGFTAGEICGAIPSVMAALRHEALQMKGRKVFEYGV